MKAKVLIVAVLLAGFATIDGPSFAHHGNAAFDLSKPVVLKGAVVTEFRWINPHPLIKADYKDDKGNVQQWTMELGSTVSARPPSSPPVWVSRMVVPSAKSTLLKRPTVTPVLACQTYSVTTSPGWSVVLVQPMS